MPKHKEGTSKAAGEKHYMTYMAISMTLISGFLCRNAVG
jgi:hypothetical protein